jgi:hypothetical protein
MRKDFEEQLHYETVWPDDYKTHPEWVKIHKKYLIDAEHTAIELNEAMDVALMVFSFPLRTAMVMLFSQKTRRNYKWANINTFLDISLFMGVFIWFIRYEMLL